MFTGRSQQNIFDLNGFKCAIYFGRCRCSEVLPDGKWRGAPSHKPPSSQAFGPACTFLPRTRLLFLTCSLPIIEYTFKTKLFIAFEKNWLVWYSLMILLRWSCLCAIGLIPSENYPRQLVLFRLINLTVVSLYWVVQTSASFSWWQRTLGSLPFSTLSRGRIGSQRQKNKIKLFSSATFLQIYFIDFQAPPSHEYIL